MKTLRPRRLFNLECLVIIAVERVKRIGIVLDNIEDRPDLIGILFL